MNHLHPSSPAMIVALIALSVALGGTGYAATQISRGSERAAIRGKRDGDRAADLALIRRVVAQLPSQSHSFESYKTEPIAVTSTDQTHATGIGAVRLPPATTK